MEVGWAANNLETMMLLSSESKQPSRYHSSQTQSLSCGTYRIVVNKQYLIRHALNFQLEIPSFSLHHQRIHTQVGSHPPFKNVSWLTELLFAYTNALLMKCIETITDCRFPYTSLVRQYCSFLDQNTTFP